MTRSQKEAISPCRTGRETFTRRALKAGRPASAYQNATAPLVLRTLDQVLAFFDGFELVEPGLVQAPLWRPDGKPPRPKELVKIGIYGGVGHKNRTGT